MVRENRARRRPPRLVRVRGRGRVRVRVGLRVRVRVGVGVLRLGGGWRQG